MSRMKGTEEKIENFLKKKKKLLWLENNFTNIRIFCTDIRILTSWYYYDSVDTDVKYRCLRMLDCLVSTHPKSWFKF